MNKMINPSIHQQITFFLRKQRIYIKTSLIEHYLDENINELSLYEEVFDKENQKKVINPNQIIKDILLNYDDITDLNGPYIELITQSGSKHIIKIKTVILLNYKNYNRK